MSNRRLFLLIVAAILLMLLTLGSSIIPAIGKATDSSNDMHLLLEELNQRALDDGLLFTVVLSTPIEDDDKLTIGYGYDDINISIYSIGADHFCTRRIAGGAERIQCIPYMNVSYIFYTNN
jgi:hypothetical protein